MPAPSDLDSFLPQTTPRSHSTGIWGQPAPPDDDGDYSYDDDLRLIKKPPMPTPPGARAGVERATERGAFASPDNDFFMPFPKEEVGHGFTGVAGLGGIVSLDFSLFEIIFEENLLMLSGIAANFCKCHFCT